MTSCRPRLDSYCCMRRWDSRRQASAMCRWWSGPMAVVWPSATAILDSPVYGKQAFRPKRCSVFWLGRVGGCPDRLRSPRENCFLCFVSTPFLVSRLCWPPTFLKPLDTNPKSAEPQESLSSKAAEDGQLKVFPETIHVLKANLAKPLALLFDRGQDVGGPVGSGHEVAPDLIGSHVLASLPPSTI